MPRIELIPADWDTESGDGTPTIDVCRACSHEFQEGFEVPESLCDSSDYDDTYIVGECDVEHPPYDDCEYDCEVCGNQLKGRDD